MNSMNAPFSKLLFALPLACLFCVGLISQAATATQDEDPPKKVLTIKEIMKEAHKDGLIKKVATEKATEDETKRLHELYKQLAKLEPPQGDKKSWEEKTLALVEAGKAAVDKDETFKAKLKAASNCAACHKIHKP